VPFGKFSLSEDEFEKKMALFIVNTLSLTITISLIDILTCNVLHVNVSCAGH